METLENNADTYRDNCSKGDGTCGKQACMEIARPHVGQQETRVRSIVENIVKATAMYMLLIKRSLGTILLRRVFPPSVTKYWSFKNWRHLARLSAEDIVASSGVVTVKP